MERSEPALAPEWLKTNGRTSSNNQFAPSLLHSDDHVVSKHAGNRPSASIIGRDMRVSSFSGQTTSSYFRQSSSSNGSSQLQTRGSLGRNQHDQRYNYYIDPLLPSRRGKNELRLSRSSLSNRRDESWPMEVAGDYRNGNKNNHDSLLSGVIVRNVHKSAFETDFPSLGTEERKMGSEIGRVRSPGPSTAMQSLPVGSSALIGSDGWTSALVAVHGVIGSNGMNAELPQQTISGSSPSTLPSLTTALNMAETVSLSPSRAGTPPLVSVETQRREELVLKQCKQLIPMTPSLAKAQVLSPSGKGKPKIGQQNPSHLVNLTLHGVPPKSDAPNTSLGKLQVLKPSRELNGVSSTAKESLSPTNGSRVVNNPLGTPSLAAGSVFLKTSINNPSFTHVENKPTSKLAGKKPSAQTKSRNDFFNLLKKKSSEPSPSAAPCSSPALAPPALKHNEITTKSDTDASIPNGEKNSSLFTVLPPDEKEAALLHSLGWEEGSGDDEGLTEEEITSFYELYPSLRPSMKLHADAAEISDRHALTALKL